MSNITGTEVEYKMQSPLSFALSLLLQSKGLHRLQLVVDNAVAPCDELIDRALDYEYEVRTNTSIGGGSHRCEDNNEIDETQEMVDEALFIVQGGAEKGNDSRYLSSKGVFTVVNAKDLIGSHRRHNLASTFPNKSLIKSRTTHELLDPFDEDANTNRETRKRDCVSLDDHKDTRWETSPTSTLQSPVRRLSGTTAQFYHGTLDITHHNRDILSIEPEDME
mmetsp:Transcript_52545/g.79745  ORF Transcript_52545/g.79745 Transcript_52545/m.79745 type:complete len:221 (+) Transcript_52545:83-745(+)